VGGEAGVAGLVAAAAEGVALVVGQLRDALTQLIEVLDVGEGVKVAGILKADDDADLCGAPRGQPRTQVSPAPRESSLMVSTAGWKTSMPEISSRRKSGSRKAACAVCQRYRSGQSRVRSDSMSITRELRTRSAARPLAGAAAAANSTKRTKI